MNANPHIVIGNNYSKCRPNGGSYSHSTVLAHREVGPAYEIM